MKQILFTLLVLFSVKAFAVNPTGSSSISPDQSGTAAGSSSIPLSDLNSGATYQKFYLYAGDNWNGLTAGNFYPFTKNGQNYIVTTTKTAYCFNGTVTNGGASTSFQYVSATSQIVWNVGALVGGVYQSGNVGKYVNVTANTTFTANHIPGTYTFFGATWPGVQPSSSTTYSIQLECYEK